MKPKGPLVDVFPCCFRNGPSLDKKSYFIQSRSMVVLECVGQFWPDFETISYLVVFMRMTFKRGFALEFNFVQSVNHVSYIEVDHWRSLAVRTVWIQESFGQPFPSISEALNGAATSSNVRENLFASLWTRLDPWHLGDDLKLRGQTRVKSTGRIGSLTFVQKLNEYFHNYVLQPFDLLHFEFLKHHQHNKLS